MTVIHDEEKHQEMIDYFNEQGLPTEFAKYPVVAEYYWNENNFSFLGLNFSKKVYSLKADYHGKMCDMNSDVFKEDVIASKFPKSKKHQRDQYLETLLSYNYAENSWYKVKYAVACMMCEYEMMGIKVSKDLEKKLYDCVSKYFGVDHEDEKVADAKDINKIGLKKSLKNTSKAAKEAASQLVVKSHSNENITKIAQLLLNNAIIRGK